VLRAVRGTVVHRVQGSGGQVKHGATIISVCGLLASFVQMCDFSRAAGGIMFAGNLAVAGGAALVAYRERKGRKEAEEATRVWRRQVRVPRNVRLG
jgi:hypothetical protein